MLVADDQNSEDDEEDDEEGDKDGAEEDEGAQPLQKTFAA